MNKAEARKVRQLRAKVRGIQDSTAREFKPLLRVLHSDNASLSLYTKELEYDVRAAWEVIDGHVNASWRARLLFLFTGRIQRNAFPAQSV